MLPGNVLGQIHEFTDTPSIFHVTARDSFFKELTPV